MKSKVLIVDDIEDTLSTLQGSLEDFGGELEVETASNPEEALDLFIRSQFDFAIVDLRLFGGSEEDISGLTLSMAFKQIRSEVGIIILTAYEPTDLTKRALRFFGALSFVEKTGDFGKEIIKIIKDAQIKSKENTRVDKKAPDTFFRVSIHNHAAIGVRSRGRHVYSGLSENEYIIDKKHSRRANLILNNPKILNTPEVWRGDAKDLGDDLWKEIFEDCTEVMRTYYEARGKSHLFSMHVETSRSGVGLPIEFIQLRNPDEYLALQHPTTRFITGISPKREAISPELLTLTTESLNVLIIASNTLPDIPGVDNECSKLNQYLNGKEIQNLLPILHTKYIPTKEATYDRICNEITNSNYDIIHYAGHGNFDNNSSEESCLYFWNQKEKSGGVRKMIATELADILQNSRTRLLYLSCCFGTTTGGGNDYNDDFLGIADSAIQAGIPSVIGFRAPVSDTGAIELAKFFYNSLFERGQPDVALWEARRKFARSNRNDPTWLSPILISQH